MKSALYWINTSLQNFFKRYASMIFNGNNCCNVYLVHVFHLSHRIVSYSQFFGHPLSNNQFPWKHVRAGRVFCSFQRYYCYMVLEWREIKHEINCAWSWSVKWNTLYLLPGAQIFIHIMLVIWLPTFLCLGLLLFYQFSNLLKAATAVLICAKAKFTNSWIIYYVYFDLTLIKYHGYISSGEDSSISA